MGEGIEGKVQRGGSTATREFDENANSTSEGCQLP